MPLTEKLKLGQVVRLFRKLVEKQFINEHRAMVPQPGCIARQYAQCDDLAHCPYCSNIEQALRAAYWLELKWPWVRGRNSFE